MIRDCLMLPARSACTLLTAALCVAAASEVRADDCATLPNPVYVSGSSAAKPFIAKVAAELRQLSEPITVVALYPGSCVGVNAVAVADPPVLSGTPEIYDNDGKVIATGCTLNNNKADIGVSDVYAQSCGVESLPSGVKDYYGPVQAMTFAVPAASSQSVISAEAAYLVFGFGNASEAAPWTDEATIEQRSATSGTQQMIAAYINVPAAKFKGHANSGSGDVVTSLTNSAANGNADKAIGILATDRSDVSRDKIKVLGYQHYGQSCAYWPDSTPTSFDKANVRDGHYPIFGPIHMLVHTNNGNIENQSVKKVVDYLSGSVTPENFDLIQLEAKGGVVPLCAMRVAHTKDGGELMSFQPDKSCECKFVKEATGAAPSNCKSCEKSADCPASAPACNYNFCEVK